MTRDIHAKALELNLDRNKYGTIAEIGAGQETARWFFRVGGAAGTIAKAMSAYDMKVSDTIYGPSPRYASQQRLQAMLDHEFQLVVERLTGHHPGEPTFFAFANTVAARSYSRQQDGQGWYGIRFQHLPGAAPSQIIAHVHLKGNKSVDDQEALGALGVNMIYAAFHHHTDTDTLLDSLMDGLFPEQAEIDMIEFAGPAFVNVDNRLMALRLVQKGMSRAAMFTASGQVVHIADALYKRPVLIERSRFRPPTKFNMNMLDCATDAFIQDTDLDPDRLLVLSEMTLHNLRDGETIDVEDFMHRIEILCALGKNVLISSFGEFYRLAGYLFEYTNQPIGVALGIPSLKEIFNERYYEHLGGGILESFGRLFKNDLRLYVCPCLGDQGSGLVTIDSYEPPAHLTHLYAYLRDNRFIRGLDSIDPEYLHIFSTDVLNKIRSGDPEWERMVPSQVAAIIKAQQLFGCSAGT